jgi:D-glycero-alpha-D-manno-heptose-7-phosphate kinase
MIISRTPFRISFAGGGTDLKAFYGREFGSVLSTAIDKYMYIIVKNRFDSSIRISYSITEIVESVEDVQHPIVRECLKLTGVHSSIEITSIADIPSGTGLGSSSSFTVGLLHALYAFQGIYVSAERLAKEACKVEIEILGEPIGKQDQYIAAFGGCQHISFHPDEEVNVEPIIFTNDSKNRLESKLLLFYLGVTRSASNILREQTANIKEDNSKFEILRQMRDQSLELKDILQRKENYDDVGRLLNDGWIMKSKLSNGISNDHIEHSYNSALKNGAIGGKVLGAGGGGFLLLYANDTEHKRIRNALNELREVPFSIGKSGSKIIFVGEDSI